MTFKPELNDWLSQMTFKTELNEDGTYNIRFNGKYTMVKINNQCLPFIKTYANKIHQITIDCPNPDYIGSFEYLITELRKDKRIKLKCIELIGTWLNHTILHDVIQWVIEMKSVHRFELLGKRMDTKDMELISENLKNMNINELDLELCSIGKDITLLVNSIKKDNIKLKTLNLSSNSIHSDGVIQLAEIVNQAEIEILDVHFNTITNEGSVALFNELAKDTSKVTELSIGYNDIGGASSIASLVSVLMKSKLKCLHFNSIYINRESIGMLSQAICECLSLEYLDITACGTLLELDIMQLIDNLKPTCSLKTLSVWNLNVNGVEINEYIDRKLDLIHDDLTKNLILLVVNREITGKNNSISSLPIDLIIELKRMLR